MDAERQQEGTISLAEAVRRLGDIPLWRIRLPVPIQEATEDDVLRIRAMPERRLCELVDGFLVEKAMGTYSGLVSSILLQIMGDFVYQAKAGIVLGEGGMMRLQPGMVRIPDVSFISRGQLPGGRLPPVNIAPLYPDLAVEVLSPSNTTQEMTRKRQEYFNAGTRLMWVIDPDAQTVEVWNSPTTVIHLAPTDSLDGAAVLPGFLLPLADLFARTVVP